MKTVAEIFEIAGISSRAVFDNDYASIMYDVGVLTGLWYGRAITLDEYRAARSALSVLHYGMLH